MHLHVEHFDLAEQFYRSLGMVEDIGLRCRLDPASTAISVLACNDPLGGQPTRSMALRWPSDPFMHLVLVEQPASSMREQAGRAAPGGGLTTLGLRVSDLESATKTALRLGGLIVAEAAPTARLLGDSESTFLRDVAGNLVELIALDPAPPWDLSRCNPYGVDKTFLHVHLNTPDLEATSAFYKGLGFTHNPLNDFRPGAEYEFRDGDDPFDELWGRGLDGLVTGMEFLRLADDSSRMHLEILEVSREALAPSNGARAWLQEGLIRMCFLTRAMNDHLEDLRHRGVRVSPTNDRAPLGWGDAEWAYFADPEDNILTLEEWFPTGHWGERY